MEEFVREQVLERKKAIFFDLLETIYMQNLRFELEKSGEDVEVSIGTRHLEEKLLKEFSKTIEMDKFGNKKVVKPAGTCLLEQYDLKMMEKDDILYRAALILREEIRNIEVKKLPDCMSTDDLIAGECAVPARVTQFYSDVLSDPNSRRKPGEVKIRLVKSLSQDLIYATWNGRIKTSKHITLGLAIKGLTNSRKVLDVVHGYGHCCSYTVLEELETEATFASTNRTDVS